MVKPSWSCMKPSSFAIKASGVAANTINIHDGFAQGLSHNAFEGGRPTWRHAASQDAVQLFLLSIAPPQNSAAVQTV